MKEQRWLPWVTGLVVLMALCTRADARACIALGRSGVVPIVGEEALIVWDQAHHIEHFIRSANFDGITEDFGFVVPTPSRPELTEVSNGVFHRLFELYRRPAVRAAARSRAASDGMSTSGVTVVEERVVAGLTSTVLQATSPEALDAWLLEHGYRSSPELVSWMAPYVRDGWMLTAFRVDPGAAPRGRVSMGAIRMSFSVERPFFPYSEPQTAGREPRPFRVSVVAPFRMTASVGRAPWPVPVAYAQRSARLSSILTGIVPAEARTGPLWITTFDEPRSVRGTSDVTFDADTVTARVASRISREIVSFRR